MMLHPLSLALTDPRRHAHPGELMYADHLVDGVGYWLIVLVAAAMLVWLFGLLVSLLGWAGWSLVWLARRCARGLGLHKAGDGPKTQ